METACHLFQGQLHKKGQWCDVYEVYAKEKQWHRWQQPLELFERLIRDFSNPGDLIVDPCGGGFTTAEACRRLGRRCVSCDVDAECVPKGRERLAECEGQLTLGA
jgi:DNA modification methylase